MQVFPPLASWAEIRTQLREDPRAETVERAENAAAKAAAHADRGPGTRCAIDPNRVPAPQESADWITRTAMCAEPRDGVLYVFMPPTAHLEEYLELVSAVESAAAALAQPLIMEGYEPPKDPRLERFSVTPDPGVIEVNIHPSGNWGELVDRTTHLYEQAHQSRLSTEKFMLDGRHTGTGGGNHFVLGGATAPDSPFLRRPTCCAAWCPTGITILHCPTCSRGCSSGRPHRHRAPMRRATTLYTNSRSHSNNCRSPAMTAPHGWSTRCSATC